MGERLISKEEWYNEELGITNQVSIDKLNKILEKERQEKLTKLNSNRNKTYEHITDELESFIYQKGIVDDYEIETNSDIDFDYDKVTDRLTIDIRMSREI